MNQKTVKVLKSSKDLSEMLKEYKLGELSLSDDKGFFYHQKQIEFAIPDPKLVVTKDDLIDGKAQFRKHYKVIDKLDVFSKSLRLSWTVLLEKANYVLQTNNAYTLNQLAIFCIHRYNPQNSTWFLTLQFCHLEKLDPTPIPGKSYVITRTGTYYDVFNEGLVDNKYVIADGALIYDPYYYNNTHYSEDGNAFSPLKEGNNQATYVSWSELQQLRDSNFEAGFDESLFKLCFTSITSNYTVSGQASVAFPHTLAVHTNYDDIDLLESGNTVVSPPSPPILHNNAADYQTLCPPNCGVYIWPTYLTRIILNTNITQKNP